MVNPEQRDTAPQTEAAGVKTKTYRRPPSPDEHKRRQEWGHKQGAKNAAAYRAELAKQEEW